MEVKALIQRLLSEMDAVSKTETVVGEPLQVGDLKLIPICRLSIGFGVGGLSSAASREAPSGGDASSEVAGAGGGIKVQPVAFIAVDPEGGAQLLCLDEPEATVVDKLVNVAPELVERLLGRLRREPQGEALEPGEAERDGG